jgi:hypothetical protein
MASLVNYIVIFFYGIFLIDFSIKPSYPILEKNK